MGKAYTSDERSEIKVRIMEAALDLYHEKGAKTLNIREIARRAGISPGGFYNFWPDKDSLVLDIMKYRTSQKLDMIRPLFKGSEADPVGFLSSMICSWFSDMKKKLDTKPIYRESMAFLNRSSKDNDNRSLALYSDFINDLRNYWMEKDCIASMDITGVTNVIVSVSILLLNSENIDNSYFEDLMSTYIHSGIDKYVKAKEQ